jgi:hypothetical protein
MKNVISFDVGMKNLAYCLFQVGDTDADANNINTSNLLDYKILRWEVINLCTPVIKKCTKGGLHTCVEVAKYCKTFKTSESISSVENDTEHENENDNNNAIIDYYCAKHAKKCNLKIAPSELDIKKIKTKKLVEIQSIIDKYNIHPILHKSHESHTSHTSHMNNEAIGEAVTPVTVPPKRQKNTKEQMIEMIQHELDKKYLENIENVRADQIDLITLGRNMMSELDKFISPYMNTCIGGEDVGKVGGLEKHKIDIVIIENQISTIASRMKTLQGMIAQYFIMRETPCIEFISAANKLKMFMTKKKTTYTERKLESVEVTKELLEKLPQFKKYRGSLDKNKKKDDLSDCFLQGIYYLTLKNMINIDLYHESDEFDDLITMI